MKIPSLSFYDIQKSDLSVLVEMAFNPSSMKANPIRLAVPEMQEILVQAP